jgi:catechol 2,3-dioxygenase-like lactoylglutathione lyase family enzyme
MKVHLSLATSDLEASVAFYAALLDREPAKVLHDYALFVAEDPGIELALALTDRVGPAGDAHFGICATSPEDVERAILRLSERGLATSIERNHTCCYAKQTKVWTSDPQGRRWEVYAVLEESPAQNDTAEGCCAEPCGCAA